MAVVHYPALNRPERPLCSVCIANFNGEGLLVDCIESVLDQAGGVEVEIIVHDDASTDGSLDLLRQRYPNVEVLASQENVGFCLANNRMVAHSRGAYVLLLNNDAALHQDALAALYREAIALGRAAILTLAQHEWQTGALVDRGCLLDPFCNPIPNLDPDLSDVAYAIGACLWCPRSTWEELGGFPEWMESIGEDLYLCGLARLRGIPVRVVGGSYFRHRQGASFGGSRAIVGFSTSVRRRALSERNKTRALLILVPGAWVWPILTLHLSALLAEGLALTLLKRNVGLFRAIYYPALACTFKEWQELSRLRAAAQSGRKTPSSHWFSTVRWQLRKVAMLWRYGTPSIS